MQQIYDGMTYRTLKSRPPSLFSMKWAIAPWHRPSSGEKGTRARAPRRPSSNSFNALLVVEPDIKFRRFGRDVTGTSPEADRVSC